MPEITVEIPVNETSYTLKIEKQLLNKAGKEIAQIFNGSKIMVVTDETVHGYYGETVLNQLKAVGYDVQCIVLPPGEQTKTFSSMPDIYSQLIESGLTRSDLIIALGGGVVGDITGFAAATYLRGISFVQIPTTLLAQVDSSVGGKVGVDLPEGKNLVGAFYHPALVMIDPLVLATLTDESFADGMAEVIKYGCIKDQSFFTHLAECSSRSEIMEQIEWVIETCCTIKKEVVQADEKDTSERMLLNFGHTLGHAIEAYYNYEMYSHGQGVAIGMVELSKIAEEKSLTKSGTTEKIISILEKHHLPTQLAEPKDYAEILSYIKKDKKNFEGSLNVIILDEIGKAQKYKTDGQFFDSLKKGGTTS